jgi:two-component system, cell cycle response regulator
MFSSHSTQSLFGLKGAAFGPDYGGYNDYKEGGVKPLNLEITARGTLRAIFNVLPIGVPETELAVLTRMFGLAKVRPLHYALAPRTSLEFANIYLVDGADALGLAEWRALYAERPLPTVFIGDQEIVADWPSIKRPMLLPRVMGALDQVAKQEAMRQMGERQAESSTPATAAAKARVLVVDDSKPAREFMIGELGKMNVQPEECDTGEEALLRLLSIDGYEVCKLIKGRRGRKPTRVVMLTSRDGTFDKIRGKLSGCDAYLTKPVDNAKLHALVLQYLSEAANR